VLESLVPARTAGPGALTGRWVAGPRTEDAVRVAAGLVPAGFGVSLEPAPTRGQDPAAVLGALIERVDAAGIASACELTLPVDRLGIARARALAAAAADAGLGVALAGSCGPVRSAADGFPDAAVVVPAGPDAERVCRAYADGRVRLVAGRGAAAGLAFVRCLSVLMAGRGRLAVAAQDPRLIAITGERAAWNGRSPDSWEYLMPYGFRTDLQRRLVAGGSAVRVRVPSGPGAVAGLVRYLAGRA
jgi:proline dehydrogenase